MNEGEIEVTWAEIDGAYLVWMQGVFIYDVEDLHTALEYALAVAEAQGYIVVVGGIEP